MIWQWHAPELWRRTTITLRRALATRLSVPPSKLNARASLQYAKVAEYQARGLVHFHALIRLDGPDGPGSSDPSLTGDELADLVTSVTGSVTCTAPPAWEADTPRVLAWGRQVDVRTVHNHTAERSEILSAEQVAGYLGKWAHMAGLASVDVALGGQGTEVAAVLGQPLHVRAGRESAAAGVLLAYFAINAQ